MTVSRKTRTLVTAGVSVGVTTATAIVVNVLTDRWHWVWWVVLAALVVLNVVVYVVGGTDTPSRVSASGAGSVAGGGNVAGPVRTKVWGHPAAGQAGGDGVSATGPGSVAAGGDVGDVETDVD